MEEVYITAMGAFLPNDPIINDEVESYLGMIHGKPSAVKNRILKKNGIIQRYYALDKFQQSTHSNAELAAEAIRNAIIRSDLSTNEIELLATGTTQGDLAVPFVQVG